MRKKAVCLSFAAFFVISALAAVPASADPVEWSEPLVIGGMAFEGSDPSIATNDHGWQVVAWSGWDGSQYEVCVNRFEPGVGWSGAEAIGIGYYDVDAGIDDAGNSIIVWAVDAMVLTRTYVQEYDSWDELTVISNSGRHPWSLQVSVCGNGGAAAIWMDWGDDLKLGVFASIRDPSASWGDAELIQQHQDGRVFNPSVAMDDDMNAIGVYRMLDGVQWNVYAIRYVNGQGWGSEALIGSKIQTQYGCKPTLAMNGDGLAIAAWHSLLDSGYVPSANVFLPDSGTWQGESLIEDSAARPSILVNVDVAENGGAVAAWRLVAPLGTPTSVRANLYDPILGWSGPTTIGEVVGPFSGVPVDLDVCAVAGSGVYVGWNDFVYPDPASWNLYANHYNEFDGWVGTSLLTETLNISRIGIAPNHLGGATIVWAASYEYDYDDWDMCVSSCSGPGTIPDEPIAVMELSEKNNDWKTWKFDGRASTDDGRVMDFLWDFGDGNHADTKVTWHRYQKAGNYTVTLTVWDDDGNYDSSSVILSVWPSP